MRLLPATRRRPRGNWTSEREQLPLNIAISNNPDPRRYERATKQRVGFATKCERRFTCPGIQGGASLGTQPHLRWRLALVISPLHQLERISRVRNRMLEWGTSASVGGEGGNLLAYRHPEPKSHLFSVIARWPIDSLKELTEPRQRIYGHGMPTQRCQHRWQPTSEALDRTGALRYQYPIGLPAVVRLHKRGLIKKHEIGNVSSPF
jgi:hypothetical protein